MSSESTSKGPYFAHLAARKENLRLRDRTLRAIRRHFHDAGFLEVETPLLLRTVATEEHIQPFECAGRYLATSPELQMKQLLCAGIEPVFQVTRSFRQGESGRLHNPEFALLEWYRRGCALENLIHDLEALLGTVAKATRQSHSWMYQGRRVDVSPPFEVVTVQDAFLAHAGWDPLAHPDPDRFDLDLVQHVEPRLGRGHPTMLVRYPVSMGALAQACLRDPRVALRGELYLEGIELANGFVELRDPREQARRFQEAANAMSRRGNRPPPLPDEYLASLPALPPCVGMALGIDRLVMLLADSTRLEDVLAFSFDDA